jgi:UDP-N-acetylmuramoylalanine--D-glutamate ligase
MRTPSEIARERYAGRKVTVVGLAREGTSLIRFLSAVGAEVTANDQGSAEVLSGAMGWLAGVPVRFILGGHPPEAFEEADIIFVSPGVPQDLGPIADARQRGVQVSSETQLFFELCRGNIAGITGSAGKTTTTTLTGEMLRKAGMPVFVGGNIGVPLLDRLDEIGPDDWVVLELSSFQLEMLPYSPRIATLLNLTPNHLDRHGTMASYIAAKQNIVRHQGPEDWAVLNADDPITAGMARPGRTKWFSLKRPVDGAYLEVDRIVLRDGDREELLCHSGEVQLPGRHNLANVAAAAAVASVIGAPVDAMREAIRGFSGVSHRLEWVGEVGGVAFYNDSIATAPDRSIASIRSFEQSVILIAGGRNKRLPLEEWAQVVRERVKSLVLMGEAAEDMERAVRAAGAEGLKLFRADSMDRAVEWAWRGAQPGDVVLLAPACASFDMYRDFEQRGERFRESVARLRGGTGPEARK